MEKQIGYYMIYSVALPAFLVGHNWFLNCGNWESIEERYLKKKIAIWRLFITVGSHFTSFIFSLRYYEYENNMHLYNSIYTYMCVCMYEAFIRTLGAPHVQLASGGWPASRRVFTQHLALVAGCCLPLCMFIHVNLMTYIQVYNKDEAAWKDNESLNAAQDE